MNATSSVQTFLQPYPPSVQQIALEARKLIGRWLPDADETLDVAARMIAYSQGPDYRGMVCTLIISKTGLKLGLVNGAALPDPHGLLQGSGKAHKYVPIRVPGDLQQTGVEELVLAASAASRERLNASK